MIPFSYMLCLFCKRAYRELNLKRALDELWKQMTFVYKTYSRSLAELMFLLHKYNKYYL